MNPIRKIDQLIQTSALVLGASTFFKRRFSALKKPTGDDDSSKRRFVSGSIVGAAIAGFIIFSVIWFLSARIAHYFDWPLGQYNDTSLYNLTAADVEWDTYYGKSSMCGELECHLTEEYPKNEFLKSVTLPSREFPLKGYKKGQFVYIRSKVKVPQFLLDQSETIVFHSIYIHAKRYTFYIAENLVYEGSSDSMFIPIPREYIDANGEVLISAKIDPGSLPYQGIAHRLDLFLGPVDVFKKMQLNASELKTTYYLWFLLPKISFCLIFAFLFLAVSRKRKTFLFIVYAFLSAAEIFFRSDYPNMMLATKVDWPLVQHITDTFSLAVLIMFLHEFFERKDVYFTKVMIGICSALGVVALAGFTGVAENTVTYRVLEVASFLLREAAVVFGVYYAMVSWVFLTAKVRRQTKSRIAAFLLSFFGLSTLLVTPCIVILALEQPIVSVPLLFLAKNVLGLYDLAFFTVLAGIYAVEVGITFARHDYIEKELEEAGNMASAFQPDDKPDWEFVDIDIYHKPLMKASGDWFAFKQAKSGKYSHYIMCDITGHGIQAAIVVSTAKTVMSHLVTSNPDILENRDFVEQYARALNSTLYIQGKGQHVVTMLGVTFEPDANCFHYFSAGHPLAIYVASKSDADIKPKISALVSRHKLLGMAPEYHCTSKEYPFNAGDELITYTDGLPLKVSRASLVRAVDICTIDGRLSSKNLYQMTFVDEKKNADKMTSDDVSIVCFANKKKVYDKVG